MTSHPTGGCTAFEGSKRIASGELAHVAVKAKTAVDRGARAPVLIFDDLTSELIEVDFRGTARDLRRRLAEGARKRAPDDVPAADQAAAVRGPGRPKLGVVAREVS